MTSSRPARRRATSNADQQRRIAGCVTLGLESHGEHASAVSSIDGSLPVTHDADGRMARGAMLVLADQGLARGVFAAFGEEQAMLTLDLRVDWLALPPPGAHVEAQVERVIRHGAIVEVLGVLRAYAADAVVLVGTACARFLTGSFPGGGDVFAHVEHSDAAASTAPDFTALLALQPVDDGTVLPPNLALVGSPMLPAIHGGFIAAALETTSTALAPAELGWSPVDVEVRYIRPANATEPLHIVPRVLRASRRTVIVDAHALQGDDRKLIASAQMLFYRHVGEAADLTTETVEFPAQR